VFLGQVLTNQPCFTRHPTGSVPNAGGTSLTRGERSTWEGLARRPRAQSSKETPLAEVTRLPGPVADLWQWQLDGSCRRESPDVFFHPDGERGPSRRNRDRQAKAVCAGCPVMQSCREHALRVREPYGVWGAMTANEREAAYAGPPGFAAARRAAS